MTCAPALLRALTDARFEALRVVHDHDGTARESNCTSLDDGLIYWQSRAWLEKHGLITSVGALVPGRYRLTDAGEMLYNLRVAELAAEHARVQLRLALEAGR